jgi:starvation-inducible DNA-binding protein
MRERFAPTDELQSELRDLLCLAVVGDHVRWVLVGDGASEFAELLREAATQWRGWADQLANHLVTLGVPPDGRVRSLAKDISVNWVPDGWLRLDDARRLLVVRLGTLAGWAATRRSQTSDSASIQLFDAVCSGLETQMKIIRAFGQQSISQHNLSPKEDPK